MANEMRVCAAYNVEQSVGFWMIRQGDRIVANVADADNAEFIVRACNNHAALTAALEKLVDDCPFHCDANSCECGENGSGFDDAGNPCVHIQARRALDLARGVHA